MSLAFAQLFSVIAACVGLAAQLSFLYLDWSYSAAIVDAPSLDFRVNRVGINSSDGSCIIDTVRCSKIQLLRAQSLLANSSSWRDLPIDASKHLIALRSAMNHHGEVLFGFTFDVSSSLSSEDIITHLSGANGLKSLLPEFWKVKSSMTEPPFFSHDWNEGYIDLHYVRSPLLWPLFDRTYTVLTTAHRTSRTIVVQSIELTDFEEATLLGAQLSYRGSHPAQLLLALQVTERDLGKVSAGSDVDSGREGNQHNAGRSTGRVEQAGSGIDETRGGGKSGDNGADKGGSKRDEKGAHHYRITMLLSVANVLDRKSMSFYLVKNHYIPAIVANVKSSLT